MATPARNLNAVSTGAASKGPQRPGSARQRLLETAGELFYRQGIGAVGVDLVSKTAGVSKRTLYQQFGSKDQLVAASLDQAGQAILGIYLPVEGTGGTPREQILAVFDGERGWAYGAEFRGCPFINTATELADPEHPARHVARQYKLRLREFFARQAQLGGAADPERLADQLALIFDGAIVQTVMGTGSGPDAARAAVEVLLDAQGVS
jgi:AcrR family transcriptional regulator